MNNTPEACSPTGSIFFRGVSEEPSKEACIPRESSGRQNSSSSEEKCCRYDPEGNKILLPREPEAITVHAHSRP